MATLEGVEQEIKRRGLQAPRRLTIEDVDREIARRGLVSPDQAPAQPVPPILQSAQPAGQPPLTTADILPPPGAPQPPQPGIIERLGPLVRSIPGIETARAGAQSLVENVPGLAQAQKFADTGVNLMGGDRGGTIAAGEMTGRGIGLAAGAALGGPPGALIGQAVGGAIAAGATTWMDRLSRGEKVTAGDVAWEMGMSAVPDIMLAGGRQAVKAGQKLLSKTTRGIKESENLAAAHLRDRAQTILKPPSQVENDRLWDLVHMSGDRLNPNSLRASFTRMKEGQWKDVMQRVVNIPAPPNSKITDFGDAAERVMTRIRDGKQTVQPLPLGELQHLRSQVQKVKMSIEDSAARDSMQLFQDALDRAMLNEKSYITGGGDIELLRRARDGFRKIRETDELADMVWSVTRPTPQNDRLVVRLGALADVLKRPKAGVQERAVAALKRQPGALEEMQEFLSNMNKVDITPGIVSHMTGSIVQGVAGVGAAGAIAFGEKEEGLGGGAVILLANVLARPASRARFNAIVLRNEARTGARTIALPMLMTLANAARRDALGTTEPQ